jgi:hypothetical protein
MLAARFLFFLPPEIQLAIAGKDLRTGLQQDESRLRAHCEELIEIGCRLQ